MEKKRCGKCGRKKVLDEFYVKDPVKGTRQSYCIPCFSARHKHYYPRNKAYYFEKKVRLRDQLVAEVIALKSKPCRDCGGSFPHYVMDFDHLDPTTKIGVIARLVRTGQREKTLREIEKCDLVCSNCHRIRTWNRSHGDRGSMADHLVVAQG